MPVNYDNVPSIDDHVDDYCRHYNQRHRAQQGGFAAAYRAWYREQFPRPDEDAVFHPERPWPRRVPQLMDIPLHVDAAAAGFVLMFASGGAALKYNFRDAPKRVQSINVSNHKFGMTFTGLGSVLFKDSAVVDPSLVYNIAYLGGSFDDYTVNFSRGSAMIVMQYYNFLNFGRAGYRAIMDNCVNNTRWFVEQLEQDPQLSIYLKNISNLPIGDEPHIHLPIIALTWATPDAPPPWTLVDLSDRLAESGWTVPAYSIPIHSPEDTDGIEVLRIVVQQVVSRDKLNNLLRSLRTAIERLEEGELYRAVQPDATDQLTRRALERIVARHTACLC